MEATTNTINREEAREVERVPADRPDVREATVPDIKGRDIAPVFDPSEPF